MMMLMTRMMIVQILATRRLNKLQKPVPAFEVSLMLTKVDMSIGVLYFLTLHAHTMQFFFISKAYLACAMRIFFSLEALQVYSTRPSQAFSRRA